MGVENISDFLLIAGICWRLLAFDLLVSTVVRHTPTNTDSFGKLSAVFGKCQQSPVDAAILQQIMAQMIRPFNILCTPGNYLIRRNFRTDKFSRIFAQDLNLREIARKLVMNFFTFAHKKIRDKFSQNLLPVFRLHCHKSGFKNLKIRRCAKICPRENFYE